MIETTKFLNTFLVLLLLNACGMSRNGSFTSTADLNPAQTKKKTSTSNNQSQTSGTSGTNNSNSQTNSNTNANALPADSPECVRAKSKVSTLYSQCNGTLFENDDVIPRSCLNAFSALSSVTCSDLNSKVSAATSACNSAFGQYSAYLPASCKSAIQALGS